MKDFNWSSFNKKIAVKASMSEVYEAWTKSLTIESWFLQRAEFFDSNQELLTANESIEPGHSYKWYWFLYDEPMTGEIKDCNGKDFISFSFEGTCLVDVKLVQEGIYTIVELRHYNIPDDDHSKQFVRLGCTNGWTFYLTNLKSVLEGGLDLRNKDSSLMPMINN